jgi:hypothetical protein
MSEHPTGDRRERTQPVDWAVKYAVDTANKIMIDVPEGQPGREDMWMMHFYASFLPEWGEPHPRLIEAIDFFADRVYQQQELAGFPDELADAV